MELILVIIISENSNDRIERIIFSFIMIFFLLHIQKSMIMISWASNIYIHYSIFFILYKYEKTNQRKKNKLKVEHPSLNGLESVVP